MQHVRVDHSRSHVLVTHQLLDCPDVVTCRQQVSGEAVAQRVTTACLGNAGLPDRLLHRLL
jgi:hypothetical protein